MSNLALFVITFNIADKNKLKKSYNFFILLSLNRNFNFAKKNLKIKSYFNKLSALFFKRFKLFFASISIRLFAIIQSKKIFFGFLKSWL